MEKTKVPCVDMKMSMKFLWTKSFWQKMQSFIDTIYPYKFMQWLVKE